MLADLWFFFKGPASNPGPPFSIILVMLLLSWESCSEIDQNPVPNPDLRQTLIGIRMIIIRDLESEPKWKRTKPFIYSFIVVKGCNTVNCKYQCIKFPSNSCYWDLIFDNFTLNKFQWTAHICWLTIGMYVISLLI